MGLAQLGESPGFLLTAVFVPIVLNCIVLGLVSKSISGMIITADDEDYTPGSANYVAIGPGMSWKPAFNLITTIMTLVLFIIIGGHIWNTSKPAARAFPMIAQVLLGGTLIVMWAISAGTSWYDCKDLCGVLIVPGKPVGAVAQYANLCCKCSPTRQTTCPADMGKGAGTYHAVQGFNVLMLVTMLAFVGGWFALRSAAPVVSSNSNGGAKTRVSDEMDGPGQSENVRST